LINKQIFQFPIIYSRQPGKTAIGWGVHTTVADECKKAGMKKVLIVTTGLKGTGIVDEIKQILTTNGISVEVYDKVESNPREYHVMNGYGVFKAAECDGVVSVGGGSSHDTGKGIRIVACNNGRNICDFSGVTEENWMKKELEYHPVTIPQVSVNTTAGTGAESAAGAAIIDTRIRVKTGIMVPNETPTIALTDPLLVRLMPQRLTAWTGWDAFTHAFECYVSNIHVPGSEAVQLRVIKIVAENLREFTYNRMNDVACLNMCYAESMTGTGMAMGGGGGIVHGFGNTISAIQPGAHHGRTMAVMTIPFQRYNEVARPDLFAEMARAMGVDTRGMTRIQAADKWFEEVERLLADLNIKIGHLNEQFGITHEDLEHIARIGTNLFTREGNPREIIYDEVYKILEDIL
jgi:methanol:N,N-dimethyl-4-nitrosoaniline oxidoreductase